MPGLPSPKMGYGILTPQVIETGRKVLGRPARASASTLPSPTGMIEDLAVVEERYQMAKWLGISPVDVPNDSVSYTFPWRVWVPCVFEEMPDECVSVRFNGHGQFLMCNRHDPGDPVDIAAKPGDHAYLDGRIKENLRPLCFFDRPGVLLFDPVHGPAVILHYNHRAVAYAVLNHAKEEVLVDPVLMEQRVYRIGQPFLIYAIALSQPQGRMLVQNHTDADADSPPRHVSHAHLPPDALLICTLRVPDDHTLDGLVPIHVSGFPNAAASAHLHGHDPFESMEDDCHMRLPPISFHVSIEQVVRPFDPAVDEHLSNLFHGVSHPE